MTCVGDHSTIWSCTKMGKVGDYFAWGAGEGHVCDRWTGDYGSYLMLHLPSDGFGRSKEYLLPERSLNTLVITMECPPVPDLKEPPRRRRPGTSAST